MDGGIKIMKKDQFIKRMQLIQNFHSEQETLNLLIDKLVDGFPVVDMGNYLVNEILEMINEIMEIKDEDLLSWWLYEDVEKIIYDEDKEISVRTLEELYDYIKKENK
jgi:hypothetical protein